MVIPIKGQVRLKRFSSVFPCHFKAPSSSSLTMLMSLSLAAPKEYQDDTVFISGIPPHVTENEIGDMFGAIGIIKVRTSLSWKTGINVLGYLI